MCGRFYVPENDVEETIVRIVEAAGARAERLNAGPIARGEVFPAQTVAALALSKHGTAEAFPMRWGFSLSPEGGKKIINTRAETADVKPMFRGAFAERRCLIPALYYYEWERRAGPDGRLQRQRYALKTAGDGPVWLAGIYRFEPGQTLPALSILTRAAAPEIAFIHDRMPVICPPEQVGAWLNRAADPKRITTLPQPMVFSAQ